MNNKQMQNLLDDIKSDYSNSELFKNENDDNVARSIRIYESAPYGNEEPFKSQYVSSMARQNAAWQIPSIVEPFTSTESFITCEPVTYEDVDTANQAEKLLNYQITRDFPLFSFMSDLVTRTVVEGTCFIKTSWEYEEREVTEIVEREVPIQMEPLVEQAFLESIQSAMMQAETNGENPELVKQELMKQIPTEIIQEEITSIKVIKNRPTAEICDSKDIRVDPTCRGDIHKAQFIIHDFETDISTLRKDERTKNNPDGRYFNLDQLEDLLKRDSTYIQRDNVDDTFVFGDEPRKRFIVHEYWGNYDVNGDGIAEPVITSYVGDVMIRMDDNPLADGTLPFFRSVYHRKPGFIYGVSLPILLEDKQRIDSVLHRGIFDDMKRANNGQRGTKKGFTDASNYKKFLQGKDFEYNTSMSEVWEGKYTSINNSVFNVLQGNIEKAASTVGVKEFAHGTGGNALGTMLDITTDMPMIDGTFKLLGDIEAGDVLIGTDGKPTNVTIAHDIRFPKQAYDIEFSDGGVVKSGGEHLWTIRVPHTYRKMRVWHTVDTDTLYEYVNKYKMVHIPRIRRPMMTGKKPEIDPYLFGCWLGDGHSYGNRITTMDDEMVQSFIDAGYEMKADKHQNSGKATTYTIKRNDGKKNPKETFHYKLRKLGQLTRNDGMKHIPNEFMKTDYYTKLALVQGMLDTDGYMHSGSSVVFCNSSKRLVDDFIRLLQSMGITPKIRARTPEEVNRYKRNSVNRINGKMIYSRCISYEVIFSPFDNPFRLSRKASRWKEPKNKDTVTVKSIKKTKKVLMRCLTVDSRDRLYAFGKHLTMTHNTAAAVNATTTSSAKREMQIIRGIAEDCLIPMLRIWLAYDALFLNKEEIIRVTESEFVTIKRDDLDGNIDIKMSISTQESKAMKADRLAFLMQTMGNSMPPEQSNIIMADLMEINDMPHLAEAIRNMEPPKPSPEQQKIQELQVELLNAQVENEYAKARENEIDFKLKSAKTRNELAKARNLDSDSDQKDLDFLMKDEGVEHEQDMKKKAIDFETERMKVNANNSE